MNFITNLIKYLIKNKRIFYLAFALLIIFISYSLFNKYKETYSRNRNRYRKNIKPCYKVFNRKNCMERVHRCIWYKNTGQCLHKNTCNKNNRQCKNSFYCKWNDNNNACEFKPIFKR